MSRDEWGRFAKGRISDRRREWIGERFGHLVVTGVEYGVQRGKKQRTICTCQCDCGAVVQAVADQLTRGKTSCGCDVSLKRSLANRVDLTGRRFGRLVVEEMLWVKPHTKCRCKCDCGNYIEVVNADLSSGHTQSCGCLQRERASEANTVDHSGEITDTGIEFVKQSYKDENGKWVWECKCPVCGDLFYDIPAFVVSRGAISCGCTGTEFASKQEEWIYGCLKELGVEFETQYKFDDLRDELPLRFDFAILADDGSVEKVIEYDGQQHFRPVEYFGGESAFITMQKHDKMKNEYCERNNIPLIRLPYTMSMGKIRDTIKTL